MPTIQPNGLPSGVAPVGADIIMIQQASGGNCKQVTLNAVATALVPASGQAGCSKQLAARSNLSTVSNPPTQAQVNAIVSAYNSLIADMVTAGMMHS